MGRRLRRNYLWIFALLALSWNLKVYLHPLPAHDFHAFFDRATVGIVPGWLIFICRDYLQSGHAIFAIGTVRLREATGEVLPQHQFSLRPLQRMRVDARRDRHRAPPYRARQTGAPACPHGATTGEFRKMTSPKLRIRESRRIDISETPDRDATVKG